MTSSLSSLVGTISTRTAEIEAFIEAGNIPQPSFSIGSPAALPLPESLDHAREEVLDAMDRLHALLLGPVPHLMRLSSPTVSLPIPYQLASQSQCEVPTQVNVLNSLQAIYHFNIAKNLRLYEQIPYEELAPRCGISTSDLRRFLRLAIANHIFSEPHKDIIAHNATSRLLAETPGFHEWIGVVSEEMWPASTRSISAMAKWPGSESPNHTGFALSSGTGTSFFKSLEQDTFRESRFATAMSLIQSSPALSPSFLTQSLSWDGPGCPKTVVDIGGSHGTIGVELLNVFPGIHKYIVLDRPNAIATATVPVDLESRLSFREYDFFTPQNVEGADVYFMRSILHDWPDVQAVEILRNQAVALKPGAKMLLNEICLPEMGVLSCYQEQWLRCVYCLR